MPILSLVSTIIDLLKSPPLVVATCCLFHIILGLDLGHFTFILSCQPLELDEGGLSLRVLVSVVEGISI